MTPKLKALEIVEKLKPYAYTNLFSFVKESNLGNAKKSALIAVEEVLKSGALDPQFKRHKMQNIPPIKTEIEYWYQVKQEIEKL